MNLVEVKVKVFCPECDCAPGPCYHCDIEFLAGDLLTCGENIHGEPAHRCETCSW